jgi:LysM repeat protein
MSYLQIAFALLLNIVSFSYLVAQEAGVKVSPLEKDKFGIDTISQILENCKVFKASQYSPKEYEAAVEKNKLFLNSLQQKNSPVEELSKEVIRLGRVALSNSVLPYLKEKRTLLGQVFQEAEDSFAESLASSQFQKAKEVSSEFDLLILELPKKQTVYEKSSSSEKDATWKDFFSLAELLLKKLEEGIELSQKAKSLAVSQVDQLISVCADLDVELVSIIENTSNETLKNKAKTFQIELSNYLKLIEDGKLKEGYQKVENLRIEIAPLVTETLAPKVEKEISDLTEKFNKLSSKFSEIETHSEDEEFSSSYQLTKDSLNAAKEALQFAIDLDSQERYTEALLQLEEASKLVHLVEEDLPSLARKQSHVLKRQGNQSQEEKKVTPSMKKETSSKISQVEETKGQPKPNLGITIYKAKPKDTLSGIAKKHYGKSRLWKKIYKANKDIKNPDLIYPNQKIQIPSPK